MKKSSIKPFAISGLILISAIVQSPLVRAESCAASSPGWPYFNNGNNSSKQAQICVWQTVSGEASIGGDKTHTIYFDNPSPDATFIDACTWVSSTAVMVTTTAMGTVDRWSATASNSLKADGSSTTRHWSTGAAWSNGENFNDWAWEGNSATWWGTHGQIAYGASKGSLLFNHGDCDEGGNLQLYTQWWVPSNVNPNPTATNASGINPAPSAKVVSSLMVATSTSSDEKPENLLVDKEANLPASFQGGKVADLTLQCPKGYMPMAWDVIPMGDSPEAEYRYSNGKVKVVVPTLGAEAKYHAQMFCRLSNSPHALDGAHHLGSKKADKLNTSEEGKHHLSGPGNDSITALGNHSYVNGGLGNDHIEIGGADSVALGGPGDDYIKAVGDANIHIVGGEGKDRLIGGEGPTFLNAVDGSGHDKVICNGTQNVVEIDRGDKVGGNCAKVVVAH